MPKIESDLSWSSLIQYYRRQINPLQYVIDSCKSPNLTFRKRLGKVYTQILFSYKEIKSIIREVRKYGVIIKAEYGSSIPRQFFHQLYLFFILGVHSKYYRSYLLFKPDRWRQVKEFTYDNVKAEAFFSEKTFPNEEKFVKNEELLGNKSLFYEHCLRYKIATPRITTVIQTDEGNGSSLENIKLPQKDIFIKTLNGARGNGAARYHYRDGTYEDEIGNKFSEKKLKEALFLSKQRYLNYIVQPVLKNHDEWKPFTSGALATCRILTAKNFNSCKITPIAATFRMPTGRSITDNFSTGGLGSPIDLVSGKLGVAVSMEPQNGCFEFNNHPDTRQRVTGVKVPLWEELLDFTTCVHDKFDWIFIAWDISYTEQGMMVIEGNEYWDVNVIESPQSLPLSKTQYPQLYNGWLRYIKLHNKN